MRTPLLTLSLLLLFLAPLLCACESSGYKHMYLQGMLGANAVGSGQVSYDDLPNDYQGDPSSNLPTAPMLAFAGQQSMVGEDSANAGVEFGGSLTWWNDGVDVYGYTGGGGTVIILDYDNRMWLTDFFVGPYGSLLLGDKVRVYGGVGPSLAWARVEYETEYELQNGVKTAVKGVDDDWSWGVYGRLGVEYKMDKTNYVGIGVRYLNADFNLSDLQTKFDLSIWSIFATFTTKF